MARPTTHLLQLIAAIASLMESHPIEVHAFSIVSSKHVAAQLPISIGSSLSMAAWKLNNDADTTSGCCPELPLMVPPQEEGNRHEYAVLACG